MAILIYFPFIYTQVLKMLKLQHMHIQYIFKQSSTRSKNINDTFNNTWCVYVNVAPPYKLRLII